MANFLRFLFAIFCYFLNCGEHVSDYPFRNPDLPWDVRVSDLVSRLTLDEVVEQMSKGGAHSFGGPAPAVPRLGIKPYQWNTECLRGDPQAGNATAFPQALTLASSWNADLIHRVAQATSVEVRAKHNNFSEHGVYSDHTGLSCFSPVINIMRHPLWGRNQETYGEDPYLTGVLGQYFVRGLHGNDKRYVRTSSGCKHFSVHGGPETNRFSFDAQVTERDWALTFQPAFKMCIEAGTYSVMCSYNSINGVPACLNKKLLTTLLREKWGFKGYVVSDEEAIENIIYFHRYLSDPVEVAARCVEAGTNLELSGYKYIPITFLKLKEAVESGRIEPDLLYERVKPLFYTRMRLGEFDPIDMNPYNSLNLSSVLSVAHQNLAREAASQSFVLLKHLNNSLPIKEKLGTLAIVGPMADNPLQLFGDYAPEPDKKFVFTPLRGLKKLASRVNYAAGCTDGTPCKNYESESVINAVKTSNLTIVCVGTGQILEAESMDRKDMSLPGHQDSLIQDVIYNSSSPIILLIFSSGPLDISAVYQSPKIEAIFQCGFPAQATGLALFDVLTNTGRNGNPSGRLPYTWYKNLNGFPDITDYTMSEQTYRYFSGFPLYPFGYGLSYTKFNYSSLTIDQPRLPLGQNLTLMFSVRNIGNFDGDEVVQVYLRWNDYNRLEMPQLQLVGFRKIHLLKGQSVTLTFVITAEQMQVWEGGSFFEITGDMMASVGGQQPYQTVRVDSNVLGVPFKIVQQFDHVHDKLK